MQPLVSVIITCYNQTEFISHTVQSVKRQTYPNIEILLVDDGSAVPVDQVLDDTSGITILRIANSGCSAARNLGFHRSTGNYVVFLDGDDCLRPKAVESHVQALLRRPQAGLIFGATRHIDADGKVIRAAHVCRARKDYFSMLLECNPIESPGAAMIERGAVTRAGLFDERAALVGAEDYDQFLRVAQIAEVVRHEECVLEYRQHANNMSRDKERLLRAVIRTLDKMEADKSLTPRQRKSLNHGRKRWAHVFFPRSTLSYRLSRLYYKFHAMLGVSFLRA